MSCYTIAVSTKTNDEPENIYVKFRRVTEKNVQQMFQEAVAEQWLVITNSARGDMNVEHCGHRVGPLHALLCFHRHSTSGEDLNITVQVKAIAVES